MPRKRANKEEGFPYEKASALRFLGVNWLRYEMGAYLISFERNPWAKPGTKKKLSIRPDILGVNKDRLAIEVEIKVDKQDFLHDFEKKHRENLTNTKNLLQRHVEGPSQLWYLVPKKLVNVVTTQAPYWAGVLTPSETKIDGYTGFPKLEIVKRAVPLHKCRMNLREVTVMAKDMVGSMATMMKDNLKASLRRQKLEEQVVALGGVVEKKKRKKRKATKTADVETKVKTPKSPVKDSKKSKTTTKSKKSKKSKLAVSSFSKWSKVR